LYGTIDVLVNVHILNPGEGKVDSLLYSIAHRTDVGILSGFDKTEIRNTYNLFTGRAVLNFIIARLSDPVHDTILSIGQSLYVIEGATRPGPSTVLRSTTTEHSCSKMNPEGPLRTIILSVEDGPRIRGENSNNN
jgi:hypothetical protein